MRGEAGRERMGGEGRGGAGRKEEAGRGRGRRQGTALAPRVSSRSLMLLEVTEDVTSSTSGGPQTMFALLGATTLVLVAGVPWMLPAAAGERRGVPAQARGGARGWAVGGVGSLGPGRPACCPGDLCWSGVTAFRSKIWRQWCSKDPPMALAWGPAYLSPLRGRPPRRLCGLPPPGCWVSESLPVDFVSLRKIR